MPDEPRILVTIDDGLLIAPPGEHQGDPGPSSDPVALPHSADRAESV